MNVSIGDLRQLSIRRLGLEMGALPGESTPTEVSVAT
jgi:hypothetical protein